MKKYIKLWESDSYTTGIYDNCDAKVFVRADGQRARIEYDGVKWVDNTGSLHGYKIYVDGRDKVRATVRRIRKAQIEALNMGLDRNNSFVLDRLIGAY